MANDDKPRWVQIGFKQSVDDLLHRGPTAGFGIAAAPYTNGQTMLEVFGQIDTGAGATGISPRVVDELKLESVRSQVIHEAGREPVTANFYEVIVFTPDMKFELTVAGLPSLPAPHDILVGRDILGRCRLSIDFTSGITRLRFQDV